MKTRFEGNIVLQKKIVGKFVLQGTSFFKETYFLLNTSKTIFAMIFGEMLYIIQTTYHCSEKL